MQTLMDQVTAVLLDHPGHLDGDAARVGGVRLTASAHPSLRHRPAALVARLKARANDNVHNPTQVLSATDTSPGELDPDPCPAGYCHLGGSRISNRDAYGAGLVNVANP